MVVEEAAMVSSRDLAHLAAVAEAKQNRFLKRIVMTHCLASLG